MRKRSGLAIALMAWSVIAFANHDGEGTGGGVDKGAVKGVGKNACQPFLIGQYLPGESYRKQIGDLQKTFSLKGLQSLNAAGEQETTRALYEIFSKANDKSTRVFYTSYSTGDNRNNHDGGDGFRVVWQRQVQGKLISAITFWQPNGKGGFRLVGGADSLRVRVQVAAAKQLPGQQAGTFVALSYQVNLQDNGSVKSLEPGVYQKEDGQMAKTTPALTHHSAATSCLDCHLTFPNRGLTDYYFSNPTQEGSTIENPLFDEGRFDESRASQTFLRHLADQPGEGAQVPAYQAALRTPRTTFVPEGLLAQLDARCRNFQAPR